MPYTSAQVTDISQEAFKVLGLLQELRQQCVIEGQALPLDSLAREHLLHGAGRRLGILRRSLQRIFEAFPPDASRPLEHDALIDVQILLHAFVMNLYGIFDNWAWAFVHRHGLLQNIGGRQSISLFKEATQRYLAPQLRGYITNDFMRWHDEYLKSYRDALAHRIPLYIPPATYTQEESIRYNALEEEKIQKILSRDFERIEQIWVEQAEIGRPCFTFLHSFSDEEAPGPVLLHPQLVTDAKTVIEFGSRYIEYWHISTVGA